jgi:hypothetical protein
MAFSHRKVGDLIVELLHVAHTAVHEEDNHVLSFVLSKSQYDVHMSKNTCVSSPRICRLAHTHDSAHTQGWH